MEQEFLFLAVVERKSAKTGNTGYYYSMLYQNQAVRLYSRKLFDFCAKLPRVENTWQAPDPIKCVGTLAFRVYESQMFPDLLDLRPKARG